MDAGAPVEERQSLGAWLWSVVVLVFVLVVITLIVLPVFVVTSGRFPTADSQAAIIGAAASWFAASLTAIGGFVALLAYKSEERKPKLLLELGEDSTGLDIWLRNVGQASAHKPIVICELDDWVYKGIEFRRWYRVPIHGQLPDRPGDWLGTRMVWVRDISIHPGMAQGVESLPMGRVQDPVTGKEIPEVRTVIARFRWTCDGGVLTRQSVKLQFGGPQSAELSNGRSPEP